VVLDKSQAESLDADTKPTKSTGGKTSKTTFKNTYGDYANEKPCGEYANAGGLGDEGGVSRYFPVFEQDQNFDPVIVARKPLGGTVAANVLQHGTGALNIDACRVPTTDKLGGGHSSSGQQMQDGWHRPWMDDPEAVAANAARSRESVAKAEELGRWPANVTLDESQAEILDEQSGVSRFFPTFKYQAKAPKKERPSVEGVTHPTVKPLELMRWLVRLVTPPGGIVLDPFAGSGTTGQAALQEGMNIILIEREDSYLPLIASRLGYEQPPS